MGFYATLVAGTVGWLAHDSSDLQVAAIENRKRSLDREIRQAG